MDLQELISKYGPPALLYMDNGPPFASDEFAQFPQHHNIDHMTLSPTSHSLMVSLKVKSVSLNCTQHLPRLYKKHQIPTPRSTINTHRAQHAFPLGDPS